MENGNNPNMTFPSNEEIGKRISALRKKRHFNQASLAEKLGKSLRTVQKYESGEIEISISIANQLAVILGTTPEFILGFDSSPSTINTLADITAFLFQLERVADLDLRIHAERPRDEFRWFCSIWFDGYRRNAELNEKMCLFLESWQHQRQLLLGGWTKQKEYELWKAQVLALQEKIPVLCLPSLRIDESEMDRGVPTPPPEENKE